MARKTGGGATAKDMPRTPVDDIVERMSVQQLTALIAAAEVRLQEKRGEAVAALRAEMEQKAAELGISAGDLFAQAGQRAPTEQKARGRRPRSDAGAKITAKYRDPETGETWSDRGRPPRWLAAKEAEGKRREEFAVAPEPELGLP